MLQKVFDHQTRTPLMLTLALSSGASIFLLLVRVFMTHKLSYFFLPWNLFLAWVPLFFALHLKNAGSKLKCLLLFCGWLLFFPNCPYIVTDIFHFRPRGIPLWYDLVLVLSFAWNGLMLGFVSLFEVQKFFDERIGKIKSWLLVFCIFVLCGFGIYLGRYGRFNSWDVLTNPFSLFSEIIDTLIHPLRNRETYGVTILFSGFLFCCYMTIFALIKNHRHENT